MTFILKKTCYLEITIQKLIFEEKKGMTKESEIIFYRGNDGNVKIEGFYHNESFWMTQKKISELFGVQRPALTKHLTNIFESGELHEKPVSSILEHTADEVHHPHHFHCILIVI
ncbi:MAG: hypothetical protein Q7V19_15105 [Bacteroidales bacterium]|nr:hypothetical protein [Bacteroidales bacterium]MDP2234899.1 hypothetical protein [Bacteroidales bacterium]